MKEPKYTILLIATWIVLIGAIVYINFIPHVKSVPLKRSFIYFPYKMDGWKEIRDSETGSAASLLRVDDILIRHYGNENNEKIELYIAYFNYTERIKGPHPPQICWLGSGWKFKDLEEVIVPLTSEKKPEATIKTMIAKNDKGKRLLVYCYKAGKKYCTSLLELKLINIQNAILYRYNNSFTMQLSIAVTDENLKEKKEQLYELTSKVLSILEEDFFPEQY